MKLIKGKGDIIALFIINFFPILSLISAIIFDNLSFLELTLILVWIDLIAFAKYSHHPVNYYFNIITNDKNYLVYDQIVPEKVASHFINSLITLGIPLQNMEKPPFVIDGRSCERNVIKLSVNTTVPLIITYIKALPFDSHSMLKERLGIFESISKVVIDGNINTGSGTSKGLTSV